MLKVSSRLFPIGYIISVDAPNFNPHDFYIDGNWERVKGRVIVGVDEAQTEFNTVGKTGGAKTHTLTVAQIPPLDVRARVLYGNNTANNYLNWASVDDTNYSEYVVGKTSGGGEAHNNLQPYQTAYIWKLISYSN